MPFEVADWAAGAVGWIAATTNMDHCSSAFQLEKKLQADVLRDLFGNPFRRVTVDYACLHPSVKGVAQATYDERALPAGTLDLARLGVLADALEEANCTDQAILAHLRGPGPHVRGCYVLDLVLGKE
jgi:hypothetical protein